jgi:hypothetical protein
MCEDRSIAWTTALQKCVRPGAGPESLAALVKSGREPKTMRWIVRALLTQNLEARLPDDESLRGIPIRRYRARAADSSRTSA